MTPAPSAGAAGLDVPGLAARAPAHPMLRLDNVALAGSVVLVLVQLRGEAAGELAALIALPVLALITFLADRRYLSAILILCMPSMGVLTTAQPGAFHFPDVVGRVHMGGVEVNGPLVVIVAAFGRVCLELLRGGGGFRGVVPTWLIRLFLIALVPAFLGALQGQALGGNQWSVGARAMLTLGGVFWGVLVARRAQRPGRLAAQLCTIVTVGAALLLARIVSDMYVFLLLGFAGGLIPYFVGRRRLVEAAILLGAAVMAALAMTLTTAAEVVVALGCVMLAHVRNPGLRTWILRAASAGALAASATLLWLVYRLAGKSLVEIATRDQGIVTYATFKLLSDRGPLWLAALQQIGGGPYWVVPAGRPLRPENFNYGYEVYLWEFGAHNAVLEITRHLGLIAGPVGIAMMLFVILAVVRVLARTRQGALRGLAAGFVGVAVPGITTGNFPVTDVGFFLWAMGGMIIAMHLGFVSAATDDAAPREARRADGVSGPGVPASAALS